MPSFILKRKTVKTISDYKKSTQKDFDSVELPKTFPVAEGQVVRERGFNWFQERASGGGEQGLWWFRNQGLKSGGRA